MLKSKILNQVQDLVQHDIFQHFAIATQSLRGEGFVVSSAEGMR
jgi:hypothetical protein